jgi:alpha-1,2-glucosyltransferase
MRSSSKMFRIVGLSIACLFIYLLVQMRVPSVYMDEIFHYNQTVRFHSGDFSWDPKITTPPGLYVLALLPILNLEICRAFNLVGGLFLAEVLRRLQPSLGYSQFFFPVSFFFHFLFYTDTWATLSILAGLHCARVKSYGLSALWCLISLLLRQTNAVWIAYIVGVTMLEIVEKPSLLVPPSSLKSPFQAIGLLFEFLITSLKKLDHVIGRLGLHILLLIGFVGFVFWNGGIALGDKSNHEMSLHFPQILYFAAFSCFFGIFGLGGPISAFVNIPKVLIRNLSSIIIFIPFIYGIIYYYTIAHPFLLADNRHFTFYLWRYFLSHEKFRTVIAPIYSFCIVLLASRISYKPFLWHVIYALALSLTLISSPLIELRYFIVPYYILRINMKKGSDSGISAWYETAFYSLINVYVFYLFLEKPFQWHHEPGVWQRFMW